MRLNAAQTVIAMRAMTQGNASYWHGAELRNCPYLRGSLERLWWRNGYRLAKYLRYRFATTAYPPRFMEV